MVAEAEIALEPEPRLPRIFIGGVGIRCNERKRQRAVTVLKVAVERGCRDVGDIHPRTRLLGVRTDQQRDIILLP